MGLGPAFPYLLRVTLNSAVFRHFPGCCGSHVMPRLTWWC